MHWKNLNWKLFSLISGLSLLVLALFTRFVMTSPIFKIKKKETLSYDWEAYKEGRSYRNMLKMKLSYSELMHLAASAMKNDNLNEALAYYYDAKTIFPEEISPRKNLCYGYLLKCQYDPEYCRRAKKEIYYALLYVKEEDSVNKDYLLKLAELVDMEAMLDLPEEELLAELYEN